MRYDNRTACDVFYEINELCNKKNYGAIEGLLEELHVIVNRMEAGLDNQRDIERIRERMSILRDEEIELDKRVNKLKDKARRLEAKCAKLEKKWVHSKE